MWRVGARRLLHLVQRRCVVTVPRHLVAMPNATTQLGLLGASVPTVALAYKFLAAGAKGSTISTTAKIFRASEQTVSYSLLVRQQGGLMYLMLTGRFPNGYGFQCRVMYCTCGSVFASLLQAVCVFSARCYA